MCLNARSANIPFCMKCKEVGHLIFECRNGHNSDPTCSSKDFWEILGSCQSSASHGDQHIRNGVASVLANPALSSSTSSSAPIEEVYESDILGLKPDGTRENVSDPSSASSDDWPNVSGDFKWPQSLKEKFMKLSVILPARHISLGICVQVYSIIA